MVAPAPIAAVADDPNLRGRDLAAALSTAADEWLARLFDDAFADVDGRVALVALGGYGRCRLTPTSDLDVVLLHDNVDVVDDLADRLWYPIWDAGVRLGHAVRTVPLCVAMAASDLASASALLSARHVAGDAGLVDELTDAAAVMWSSSTERLLRELAEDVERRHEQLGEVAFLLEPDLKNANGGLRDIEAAGWADRLVDELDEADRSALHQADVVLFGVRVELSRITGRADDRLLLDRQDAVAERFGQTADELMAAVSGAARTVAWIGDELWRRVRRHLDGGASTVETDRPLASGVLLRHGLIRIVSDPATDPTVVLRAAAAAARAGTTIDRRSLDLLTERLPVMPDPWPADGLAELIALLGSGHSAIRVFDALDHVGVLTRILPEWEPVRFRPQRNAYHRFTVDRHLHEAAAEAARLVDRVRRPDLLLFAAWLHDLGKGYPGDHSIVGADLMRVIAGRVGFPSVDVDTLTLLVRHHLLLPDVATRRDLSDEGILRRVAEQVGDPATLELLRALTEADSIATGPAAWGDWKASLVRLLAERVTEVMGGGELASISFLTEEHRRLLEDRDLTVKTRNNNITVVSTDRPGSFSRIAGVLALRGLDVLEANAHSADGLALSSFTVRPSVGTTIDWDGIEDDIERALRGRIALGARLAERERVYARRGSAAIPSRTHVVVTNAETTRSTVVDVRTGDRVGVLYYVTRALADLELDIRHAKVQTLGHEVLDAFHVTGADGSQLSADDCAEVNLAIRSALGADDG